MTARYIWSDLSAEARRAALQRPAGASDPAVCGRVAEILADVRERGAEAVAAWSLRLDGHAPRVVEIDDAAVEQARRAVAPEDLAALRVAGEAVRTFSDVDRPAPGAWVETAPGARCRRVWRPIPVCGLYVPGGTAPLFSTLLMLALPAQAAGVPERIVVTPPARNGSLHPMMVLAAWEAGVEQVHLVGGAQAVAALAFGAGLPRADKIFGPGNVWVAEAKRQAAALPGGPAVDLPAGPSELMVIADGAADPRLVAADLLSQAEHDRDAQVVLVALGDRVADAVDAALADLLPRLPRAETARVALASSRVIVCRDVGETLQVADAYAPEHLSLHVEGASALAERVSNAGTVFVGRWAAESFGDYLAGPSHVLPTGGAARAHGGVSTASFMKSFVVQEVSADAAARWSAPAARLARAEGLEAHALAADLRGVLGKAA